MSAKTPPVGIDHPTVVPTNFDGNDAGIESDASADVPAESETERGNEP